jgi:hypothetical protein
VTHAGHTVASDLGDLNYDAAMPPFLMALALMFLIPLKIALSKWLNLGKTI